MSKNTSYYKSILREKRDIIPESTALRIHRSISWLSKAEEEQEDHDSLFIFNWIAFNALYGAELEAEDRISEKTRHSDFFHLILDIDTEGKIYDIIWQKFSDSIRLILDNKYIYQKFWDFHNGDDSKSDWKETFEKRQEICKRALLNKDTYTIIKILFKRLYTLRNQLIHGGATWNSSVNRQQVISGAKILSDLLPVFIELMLEAPDTNWGKPNYPVIKE